MLNLAICFKTAHFQHKNPVEFSLFQNLTFPIIFKQTVEVSNQNQTNLISFLFLRCIRSFNFMVKCLHRIFFYSEVCNTAFGNIKKKKQSWPVKN